jgi:3-hydroxyisobutyrate dehydrogenase-like beta-hydroxyacid dehydrogenase
MQIGFIGLGSMGQPIASNLRGAGHDLIVFNRSIEKAEAFARAGGRAAHDAEEAVQGDAVLSILANDNAIEEVFFEKKNNKTLIERHAPDTVHISLSTMSIRLAKKMSQAYEAAGYGFVSATVMGRPDVAARGELIVMAAGAPDNIKRCMPIFDCIGKATHNLGPEPSQANVAKVSANFMLSSMIHTFAEALALVRKNGVDQNLFYEIMAKEFFASPIYAKYGKIMVEGNYDTGAFTVKGQEKDTRLALECGQDAQVPLLLASAIENTFLSAIGRGFGEADPCVIAKVIAQNAGLPD